MKFTEDESIILTDKSGNEIIFDTVGSNITVTAPETMTFNCKNMNINVGENMTTSVGMNKSDSIGMNSAEVAGMNILKNATMDYSLNATNITNIAQENIKKEAKDYTKQAEKIEMYALKENIQIKSAKTVQINSGEKSNLH